MDKIYYTSLFSCAGIGETFLQNLGIESALANELLGNRALWPGFFGTIRLKMLKTAVKVVHSARYTTFKLCSSFPYKNEFYETLGNIHCLQAKLE